MDEALRVSLMERYLMHGEREVFRTERIPHDDPLGAAYYSKYIKGDGYNTGGTNFKITPEGIEALKNG